MEVIATKPGFFGKLRAIDDKFEVPDDTKKASWFHPTADDDTPSAEAKAAGKGGKAPAKGSKAADEPLV